MSLGRFTPLKSQRFLAFIQNLKSSRKKSKAQKKLKMKISLFWLFFAVEGGRYYKYAKPKAQKAAAKTQMMIRDADGVSF